MDSNGVFWSWITDNHMVAGKQTADDVQGLLSDVATNSERKTAHIRLEIMSHREIMCNICLQLGFAGVSVFIAAFVCALMNSEEIEDSSSSSETGTDFLPTLLILDETFRMICFAMILILLLSFGSKVIRIWFSDTGVLYGEQIVVILLAFLVLLSPGCGIFSLSEVMRINHYLETMDADRGDLPGQFLLNPAHSFFSRRQQIASRFATIFTITCFYVLVMMLKGALSSTRIMSPPKDDKRCKFSRIFSLQPLYKATVDNKDILAVGLVYLFLYFTLTMVFDFNPSYVPFIGFFTVLKVCFSDVDSFYKTHERLDLTRMASENFCSDETVRNRAIAITIITAFEAFLVFFSWSVSRRCRKRLRSLDYRDNRSRHLGYQFLSLNLKIVCFFAFLNASLLVFSLENQFWLITFDRTKENFSIDPLNMPGLPAQAIGMSSVLLILCASIFFAGIAYLPAYERVIADLLGKFIKFVCPCVSPSNMSRNVPIYFKEEKEVQHLMDLFGEKKILQSSCSARELEREGTRDRIETTQPSLMSRLLRRKTSERHKTRFPRKKRFPRIAKLSSIEAPYKTLCFQAERRGILVFETVIQTFSLAELTYSFSATHEKTVRSLLKEDGHDLSHQESNQSADCGCYPKKRMSAEASSFEDLKEDIELTSTNEISSLDPNTIVCSWKKDDANDLLGVGSDFEQDFSLRKYIFSRPQDVHCLVATAKNRILVGFRGTISLKQMEVDARYGFASPKINESFPEIFKRYCKQREKPALGESFKSLKVHQGFRDSMKSVFFTIISEICKLLEEDPKRVVFVSGHSLGGALALMFGFYLKIYLNEKQSPYFKAQEGEIHVACHTYASPRIGNKKFQKVFNGLIGTAYRFEQVGDIIPKLPRAEKFVSTLSYVCKTYHHVGIRILIDTDGSWLLDPTKVEKFLFNTIKLGCEFPRKHSTLTYTLSFMAWSARRHGDEFTPNWWLSVLNSRAANLEQELKEYPEKMAAAIRVQCCKPNATFITNNRVFKFAETQTDDSFYSPV